MANAETNSMKIFESVEIKPYDILGFVSNKKLKKTRQNKNVSYDNIVLVDPVMTYHTQYNPLNNVDNYISNTGYLTKTYNNTISSQLYNFLDLNPKFKFNREVKPALKLHKSKFSVYSVGNINYNIIHTRYPDFNDNLLIQRYTKKQKEEYQKKKMISTYTKILIEFVKFKKEIPELTTLRLLPVGYIFDKKDKKKTNREDDSMDDLYQEKMNRADDSMSALYEAIQNLPSEVLNELASDKFIIELCVFDQINYVLYTDSYDYIQNLVFRGVAVEVIDSENLPKNAVNNGSQHQSTNNPETVVNNGSKLTAQNGPQKTTRNGSPINSHWFYSNKTQRNFMNKICPWGTNNNGYCIQPTSKHLGLNSNTLTRRFTHFKNTVQLPYKYASNQFTRKNGSMLNNVWSMFKQANKGSRKNDQRVRVVV